MKRKDMIDIIRKCLRRELRNENIKEPYLSNVLSEGPENLLRTIEESGMLPAKIFKPSGSKATDPVCYDTHVCKNPNWDGTKGNEYIGGYIVSEWEDENEET